MKSLDKRAFTLIELLVVIAIIAILAAILFPVFALAKKKAKATACIATIKQVALAQLMYAGDFDDTVPNWKNVTLSDPNDPMSIPTKIEGLAANFPLLPYSQNSSIFNCPEFSKDVPQAAGPQYMPNDLLPTEPLTALDDPSGTAMFGDPMDTTQWPTVTIGGYYVFTGYSWKSNSKFGLPHATDIIFTWFPRITIPKPFSAPQDGINFRLISESDGTTYNYRVDQQPVHMDVNGDLTYPSLPTNLLNDSLTLRTDLKPPDMSYYIYEQCLSQTIPAIAVAAQSPPPMPGIHVGNLGNIAFADGHVKALNQDDTKTENYWDPGDNFGTDAQDY